MRDKGLRWLSDELGKLQTEGLRRELPPCRRGAQDAAIEVGGKIFVHFGSNDYLGLAGEALNDAVVAAVKASGWGSGASPLVSGRGSLHAELERQLAEFEGSEAALLFNSGYAANLGTVAALAGNGDVIFSDAKNHASLIDGCRLSRAHVEAYPHADPDFLAHSLTQARRFRRRLIVTDGLFSMDGDLAPLVELAELADRHDAMLLVDEAHATGVFGANGRGASEELGVESLVHVRVGTLSKALGSAGGFVAGSRPLIDWLTNRARSYVFSTAAPEACAAAALEALRIVRDQPNRRRELLARSEQLRARLTSQGWSLGRSQSQILPVLIGQPVEAMRAAQRLRERGLIVPAIRPPAVPPGESLLRVSLTWRHTPAMIDHLIDAMAAL
jgi:8-amino-7-oxononanoate synthase